MATLRERRSEAPWVRRLYVPAYSVREAARYAGGISAQAVSNWHFRVLPSVGHVAMPDRKHRTPLNYLQAVEVAIVATFRKLRVPLKNIALARQYLAQVFKSEFPFAEYQFKTDGYHLLMSLADVQPHLETEDLIVADANGQLAWNAMMQDRLLQFDYDSDYELALRWHVVGHQSLVLIDPRIAFGAPMVEGLPTWVLRGRWNAGESISDIRKDFPISDKAIHDALVFEGISVPQDERILV